MKTKSKNKAQDTAEKLDQIRQKIDGVNKELISLLNKRLFLALQALAYKKHITDRKREKEILEKFPSDYLKAIFKQIISSTKKEQAKVKKRP